jgi:hypothetical protein
VPANPRLLYGTGIECDSGPPRARPRRRAPLVFGEFRKEQDDRKFSRKRLLLRAISETCA